MADLRLSGWQLSTLRAAAENPVTRRVLWRVVSQDFGLEDLEAAPAAHRGKVENVPCPIAGRPPHHWEDQDLGAPESGERLQDAYRAGSLTPTEATERLFARLRSGDFGESTYSPFLALDEQGAMDAAAASTERWKKGEPLSALDGVPVPVKDEFHMHGLPTRGGTSWRNHPVYEDAFIVDRMRAAGVVLPGKVHATENGLNPLGYNPHFDYPRNVYSRNHGAAGSSTGSAVAVGLGLAPVAISTDGGGSIRIPAAINGLFGLKPTLQRLSGTGDIWTGSVGHTGPIGASSVDLVDLLEVTAAFDPLDPMTGFCTDWNRVLPTWRHALGRGLRGAKVGVLAPAMDHAEAPIISAIQGAIKAMEEEGAQVRTIEFPMFDLVNAVGALVIAGEGTANATDDLEAHRDAFGEELRLIYGLLNSVSAQEHLRALRVRTALRHELARLFTEIDLLVLPTTGRQAAPYPLSENRVQVADTAYSASMTLFNFLGNLTGVPAASVPVGMANGLPIGMQIMGDAFDEASVIAAVAHLERIGVTRMPKPPAYRTLFE